MRAAKSGLSLMICMISVSIAAILRSIYLSCLALCSLSTGKVGVFALFLAAVRFLTNASLACVGLEIIELGLGSGQVSRSRSAPSFPPLLGSASNLEPVVPSFRKVRSQPPSKQFQLDDISCMI